MFIYPYFHSKSKHPLEKCSLFKTKFAPLSLATFNSIQFNPMNAIQHNIKLITVNHSIILFEIEKHIKSNLAFS